MSYFTYASFGELSPVYDLETPAEVQNAATKGTVLGR